MQKTLGRLILGRLILGLAITSALGAGANQARPIELRRDLHRHPEVSGQEARTARVVAERLRALGLEVQTGVGGHGVVGILRGGRPGPGSA